MSVVAKLHVKSILIEDYKGGGSVVELTAVARGDRNRTWAAATPCGKFTIHADEEQTDLFLGLVRSARQLQGQLRAQVEAEMPPEYLERSFPLQSWMNEQQGRWQRHPEVLVFQGDVAPEKDTPWQIERSARIESIAPAVDKTTGTVVLSNNGGPHLRFEMQIENKAAFAWFWQRHTANEAGFAVPILIVPSYDGYLGDGHAFREGSYPPGIYGHGTCAECGRTPELHS